MRITIETDESSQGAKTVDLAAPAQTSGGAAPASSALSRVPAARDDRMHLIGGPAPTLASLARVASAKDRETGRQAHGATTDAGPAPQSSEHTARAADEPHEADDKGKARRGKENR